MRVPNAEPDSNKWLYLVIVLAAFLSLFTVSYTDVTWPQKTASAFIAGVGVCWWRHRRNKTVAKGVIGKSANDDKTQFSIAALLLAAVWYFAPAYTDSA